MANDNIFQLIYGELEERSFNNVAQNLKQDGAYQKASKKEAQLYAQYEKMNLSKKQRKIINKWVESVQAKDSADAMVLFRMGMQYCFSILTQLSGIK